MRRLDGINPQRVFHFFEDICSIPHGSGNTDKISSYCEAFAKSLGLDCIRDRLGNVIIRKPASAGKENRPAVILQGHLDMVCEKESGVQIDFLTDPLNLKKKGDFIFADGTTLGGDDGIAVAMILAVLEDKTLSHPPIEALLTVDEETGMYGADGLDGSLLQGKTLINIDSEEEGVLTAGCAGGARADIFIPLRREARLFPCRKIIVSGLAGGHSGVEINKGRLNANKIMGKFLSLIKEEYRIISVMGGLKDNAIPRSAECIISTDAPLEELAADFALSSASAADPDITVLVENAPQSGSAFDSESSRKAAEFLNALPNGVIAMDKYISGLVQTSLNLGILTSDEKGIQASFSVRSSVNSEKTDLLNCLCETAENFGGSFSSRGHYPAWEYKEKSRLRSLMEQTYLELYGNPPKTEVIHAGLECGLLSSKIAGFDAVSIGPDIFDIHTPAERLSVSSAERTYNYLLKVLERL